MAEGYVTEKMIETVMPPKNCEDSLIIICGP
jgi:hypothetical protein